jgi:hypothetical protein
MQTLGAASYPDFFAYIRPSVVTAVKILGFFLWKRTMPSQHLKDLMCALIQYYAREGAQCVHFALGFHMTLKLQAAYSFITRDFFRMCSPVV